MANSSVTPVWGPHLPRLKRVRESKFFTQALTLRSQARDGVTLIEAPWGPPVTVIPVKTQINRIEDTIRNPNFDRDSAPPNWVDDGGNLKIQKSWWTMNHPANGEVTPWKGNTRYQYGIGVILGTILDEGINVVNSHLPPTSDADLSSYHAAAFKAIRPDRPLLDLLTAVVELRDFAKLKHAQLQDIKDLSDYWLAINFGWKPLFQDIVKLYKSVKGLDERLRYMIRNNGKPVRGRSKVSSDSTVYSLKDDSDIGITRNTYTDWPGRAARLSSWHRTVTCTYTREVWASGRFVMWMKDIELPKTQMNLKMGLLGLNPTPAAVWNAMPWSWLIDWLTNIGDILDNLSNSWGDRLVAEYAYIMGQTTRKYRWHGTDGWYTGSAEHHFVTKIREVIHPYGLAFGASLSARQLSILAAIGSQRF